MKTFKEYTRDYKAEYKKYQSSPERIKYRAELVKYNREKGTYGNGDKRMHLIRVKRLQDLKINLKTEEGLKKLDFLIKKIRVHEKIHRVP